MKLLKLFRNAMSNHNLNYGLYGKHNVDFHAKEKAEKERRLNEFRKMARGVK